MREIKFRAWIVSDEYPKGIMVFPEEGKSELLEKCSQSKYSILLNLNGSILTSYHKPHITSTTYGVVWGRIGHSEQILMQFIGLKDKNGKDIYEGDIVKVNHPRDITKDFTNTTGVVFYDKTEGCFCHVGHRGRPPKRMWKYCKVIGNKFENPELVK